MWRELAALLCALADQAACSARPRAVLGHASQRRSAPGACPLLLLGSHQQLRECACVPPLEALGELNAHVGTTRDWPKQELRASFLQNARSCVALGHPLEQVCQYPCVPLALIDRHVQHGHGGQGPHPLEENLVHVLRQSWWQEILRARSWATRPRRWQPIARARRARWSKAWH